ncbi:ABC transporter permease [Phytohabitans kaempferiae]|uniref:ABC transporter permease n=1 Tax=Phytohabitans kaempferiae TaxID=1620943 RepID=A0ABV6MC83_9ACTN
MTHARTIVSPAPVTGRPLAAGPQRRVRTRHVPRRIEAALLPALTTVLLCGVWEVLARTVLPPEVRPISSALAWLGQNSTNAELWTAIGHTLSHWAVALSLALVAGTVLGVATGANGLVNSLLSGVFEFVRPIPAVVYLPLMLLLLGATAEVAISLAALSAFWPILFQVFYGVKSIDPIARDTARVFGLSRAQQLRYVAAPSILPFLATGVRIASTIALLASIVMELLGGVSGLGAVLARDSYNGLYDAMYGILVIAGCLGVILNLVFARLERRLLRWHPGYRPVSA